jgi:hypothetical protein
MDGWAADERMDVGMDKETVGFADGLADWRMDRMMDG